MDGTFDDITDLCSAESAASQIMIPLQQSLPDVRILAITAGDRHNSYGAQFLKRTMNFGELNSKVSRVESPPGLKAEAPRCWRQVQDAFSLQPGKRLAATSFLKSAVGGTLVKPFAHISRQHPPRYGRVVHDCQVDFVKNVRRKFLSADAHEKIIPITGPGVKSVQ
jgi:hypothetical protein